METRSAKKKRKDIDNGGHHSSGKDRLSSLPDNLLITILSLLPLPSAVTTSVLSCCWRYLWTHITHVSLRLYGQHFLQFHNLAPEIDNIISKLTSPKIHTLDIDLPNVVEQMQLCSSLLVLNIHEIYLRNPEVISLSNLCHLSASIFKTESLVELKLDSVFKFDFSVDDQIVINLPKLKKLDFSLFDSHRLLMHTLFESCPLLESLCLFLYLKDKDHHVDIVAPELKLLTIVIKFDSGLLLLIDAPKLVHLKTHGVSDSVVFYHIVKNLRCLQEGEIIIPWYGPWFDVGDENDHCAKILALFQGISCARSLTFNGGLFDCLSEVALPIFHNLVL